MQLRAVSQRERQWRSRNLSLTGLIPLTFAGRSLRVTPSHARERSPERLKALTRAQLLPELNHPKKLCAENGYHVKASVAHLDEHRILHRFICYIHPNKTKAALS